MFCAMLIATIQHRKFIAKCRAKKCLATNFRKLVKSKATINNGRIVMTNGMITLEQHTGGINMNGVRARETNSVDTDERSP